MTLYAEPNEDSDMLFGYYSGAIVEVTEVTRTWGACARGQRGRRAGRVDAHWDLAYTALKERDGPHVVRYADAGELTVYAEPNENAKVLRETNRSADIIGIGSDGWAQLNWNVAKDETEDNQSGFVRLGDDAELGKPSRMEHYFVASGRRRTEF